MRIGAIALSLWTCFFFIFDIKVCKLFRMQLTIFEFQQKCPRCLPFDMLGNICVNKCTLVVIMTDE